MSLFKHLFLVFVLFVACNTATKIDKPEKVGQKMFQLLQHFNELDSAQYAQEFIQLETIHKIAANDSLDMDNEAREQMLHMTKEQFARYKNIEYKRVQNAATRYDIDWTKIEFVSFELHPDFQLGFDASAGMLEFISNGKSYHAQVAAYWDKDFYQILRITSIRPKR